MEIVIVINNLLRKFWKLPRNCHTSIFHCVSSLQSLYNMLCKKARATGVSLVRDIFAEAPHLSYTTFGFKALNYNQTYNDADKICSNFIRDISSTALLIMCSAPITNPAGYVTGCPLYNQTSGCITGRPVT